MDLSILGWSERWAAQLQAYGASRLVRIIARHKGFLKGIADGRELNCYLPGKLQRKRKIETVLPVVGDWCVIGSEFNDESGNPASTIIEVLPRFSKIARIASGHETEEQVLAANVDYCFIATSANREFNIKRLQRYFLVAQQGQTYPIIILSKIDAAENLQDIEQELDTVFPGVPVVQASVPENVGLQAIRHYLQPGKTGVFIGSSGVGKSTLVNALLRKDVQKIQSIRESDDRGRHTTSASSLLFIPDGGMVIDTAGLREIQVYGETENLERTFENIRRFAEACRFRDCTHRNEPGCAVQEALKSGELEPSEYANHIKLLKEMEHSNRQLDQRAVNQEKKRWKQITADMRKKGKSEDK